MDDINTLSLEALYARFAETGLLRRLIALARDEDLGGGDGAAGFAAGDLTSLVTIPETAAAQAVIVARQPFVLAGVRAIPAILQAFAPSAAEGGQEGVAFQGRAADGYPVEAGQAIGILAGPARQVLAAERTLLNMLGRLSGVATMARRYVDAVAGAGATILDTRKTTPGLRLFEKYAARCGGAHCHRLGLYDAVLIKDNHLAEIPLDEIPAFLRNVTRACRHARAGAGSPPGRQGAPAPPAFIEVEVDTLDQLDRVLSAAAAAGAGAGGPPLVDIVLLDNFPLGRLREAVQLRERWGARGVLLEASGGVNLDTVRAIAETGVDRISVGAITHQAVGVDVGLDILTAR